MSGRRILSHIGSIRFSFEHNKNFRVHYHRNFGFSMTLGSLDHYLEFTPPIGYSSSPYGEFIDASYITKFHHQLSVAWVIHLSHALVQRKPISLCHPFLRTLEFACRPYPYCVSESHESVVLPHTLVLLSLWVGKLEPNNQHLLIIG